VVLSTETSVDMDRWREGCRRRGTAAQRCGATLRVSPDMGPSFAKSATSAPRSAEARARGRSARVTDLAQGGLRSAPCRATPLRMHQLPHKLATRNPLLAARAHGLRRAPTASEAKLWAALSGGKLGVAFRRQLPVGHRYIVDFLAPSLKLVVEVDGSAHARRRRADARRDEWLRRCGYRVVRLEAAAVVHRLAEVAAHVARAIGCTG
jgi:very-short-patch-repair endonuclease